MNSNDISHANYNMLNINIRTKLIAFVSRDVLILVNKGKYAENIHIPVKSFFYTPQNFFAKGLQRLWTI
jgi:hypothetical protein